MGWFRKNRSIEPVEKDMSSARVSLELEVNGKARAIEVDRSRNLLHVLRKELGLVRSAGDCGGGDCGACLVLVDDKPLLACSTPAVDLAGRSITTAEGLLQTEPSSTVPQAFEDHDVFFCGSCTPGQMIATEGMLRADPDPPKEAILQAMSAVDCRCGGQHLIYAAMEKAIELRRQ